MGGRTRVCVLAAQRTAHWYRRQLYVAQGPRIPEELGPPSWCTIAKSALVTIPSDLCVL